MNKEELITLVNELLEAKDLSDKSEELKYLKRQYKYLSERDEDSFYEKQQTEKFLSLYSELAKKEPKLTQSAYQEKENIIADAKKLLDRKDILNANKELDRLSIEFKNAGRCSKKEQDDELWNRFREVKDEFYNKKKAYFDELDKSNAEKKAKKEDIIARAKELVESFENIKEANAKMGELMNEWKAVGYSGRGDEHLWKEFSKVMNQFQDEKKHRHNEIVKMFEERAAKKEQMIKDMKILLADSDFSDDEISKVKNMRKEFNAIGFAGKDKDDELYERFNEVVKKYFEEMKFYKI